MGFLSKAISSAKAAVAPAAASAATGFNPYVTAGISAFGNVAGGYMQSKMSAEQAKLNREFQERMSSTAYQRAAADLEAAGLNRILALGSPASTPGGAMGQVANFGQVGSDWAGGMQAGAQAQSTAAGVHQTMAQTDKIIQETKNLSQRQKILLQQSELWNTIGPILVQTGRDFNSLLTMTKDTAFLQTLINDAMSATKAEGEALRQVIINYYGEAKEGVVDFANSIMDYIGK